MAGDTTGTENTIPSGTSSQQSLNQSGVYDPNSFAKPNATNPMGKSDQELKQLFDRLKREAFDQRWIFERQWLRNIYYILGRQWIFYNTKRGEWQDKRLAKWIPRPVTNKCKEIEQAIRAMFTAIQIGVNVRPNGDSPENIVTASVSDQLAPVLHDDHCMDAVMNEFDYWFIVTGNAFLHTAWEKDAKFGMSSVQHETCVSCTQSFPADQIATAGQKCPNCKGSSFMPTLDEQGQQVATQMPNGKAVTYPLSPLELAFSMSAPRWSDMQYVIRLRWRTKLYFETHDELKDLVPKIRWQKAPSDRSLQIFRTMPLQNDLGTAPLTWGAGPQSTEEEGISEYELWLKPCSEYPEGLVLRMIGDDAPQVVHMESENLPGPFPYHNAAGNPLFPFAHAAYQHVGGRIYGSGALDPIIQKQDQVNQLDSLIQMIVQRMANPIWLEPKGAEVEKFTGEPGLVVKWNPLVAGGNAKPERLAGQEIQASLFEYRTSLLQDIEEQTGTFDIVKGAKPAGVEAFSALQLLAERGQARFANAFQARGTAYADWFKIALELEREFGPDERTKASMSPTKAWTFQTFKKAQMQGDVSIIVEDGTNTPKTSLGQRAAIEHLNQLGFVDAKDPDQKYQVFQKFGMSGLSPSLDTQVQAALRKQEAFETWLVGGGAQQPLPSGLPSPSPLRWLPWFDPQIHKQELLKWANSDRMVQLMAQFPQAEAYLDAHLQAIVQAMIPPPAPPEPMKTSLALKGPDLIDPQVRQVFDRQEQLPPPAAPIAPPGGPSGAPVPQGAAMGLRNSNQNSAPVGNTPQPAVSSPLKGA